MFDIIRSDTGTGTKNNYVMKKNINSPETDKVLKHFEADNQPQSLYGNDIPEKEDQAKPQSPYDFLLFAVSSGNKQDQLKALADLDTLEKSFRHAASMKPLSRIQRFSRVQCLLESHGLSLDNEVRRKHYGSLPHNLLSKA